MKLIQNFGDFRKAVKEADDMLAIYIDGKQVQSISIKDVYFDIFRELSVKYKGGSFSVEAFSSDHTETSRKGVKQ